MGAYLKVFRCRNIHRSTMYYFIVILVLYCILYTGRVQVLTIGRGVYGRPPEWNHRNTPELQESRDKAVQDLIQALRAATELAANGENESTWFTPEAQERWNRENPCLSRSEIRQKYRQRESVPYSEPHPRWREVLQEYSKLHRTCMHKVQGDPTSHFLSRNASVQCQFMVVDTEDAAGLGNRLVMIAAAFAYSLVTQRVLLIAREILPPQVVCEPFEGSSWRRFDPNYAATPFRVGNTYWNKSRHFHGRIDAAQRNGDAAPRDYAVADGEGWYTEQVDSRFFCDTEQGFYQNVQWVYIMGCLYFTPKLYAVPLFRPVLDALFPDRAILTNVLRDLLPPSDAVWTKVKSIEQEHRLQQADRRLGIQMRYRYKFEQFEKIHRDVEERVLRCGMENHLLPRIDNTNHALLRPGSNQTVQTTSVFVASLFEGVKTNLSETFGQYPMASGERVQVVQLSHEGEQKYGVDIFQEALAEIVTLSFSDSLLVTPQSTFSGVAQGYGGLVPWFIEFREEPEEPEVVGGAKDHRPPCTRGQTVDVCFQVPYDYTFKCAYDAVNGYDISHVFPDIQKCLDADTPGLQLITDSSFLTDSGFVT